MPLLVVHQPLEGVERLGFSPRFPQLVEKAVEIGVFC